MAGFIYKLQNILNMSPENNDTDISIARNILKHINEIKSFTSLQSIADICLSSTSSISRFSQRMGYTNFNDFKADCLGVQNELEEMIIDTSSFHIINYTDYMQAISNSLINMNKDPMNIYIEQLCEYIFTAERIYIFATHIPGDLACILQRAILTTGKFIEFYPRKEHQIEIAKQIRKDDLCIFFSLEGTLLMEKAITIPVVTSLATTVLVTQNIHIKFSEQFTQVIGLGNPDSENIGKYKLLFFIDCLLNHYYHKYIAKSNS